MIGGKLIKVCGMRDAGNIRAVESLGIDMMGFIFYPRSPRCVGEKSVYLPRGCRRVGVFVDETLETTIRTAREYGLDYIQLHGSEPVDYCACVAAAGYGVIKAFSVSGGDDLLPAERYGGVCDLFLFDTKTELRGGSGNRFDWEILARYAGNTPFLLSGGIGADSAEAVKAFRHPAFAGIDINSCFETAPGTKDAGKIQAFLENLI